MASGSDGVYIQDEAIRTTVTADVALRNGADGADGALASLVVLCTCR